MTDPAVVERFLDDRERQGFPRYISSPSALGFVAAILREHTARAPQLPKKKRAK